MSFTITKKQLILWVFTCVLFISSHVMAKPNHKYASIVLDADSGQVLSERYADKKLHPASLTKMMTLYLVFDALDTGRWTKKTRLHVSRKAQNQVPSKLGLKKGTTITVEDAIKALVIKSANDVAVVVAENYAGTESGFATKMTKIARSLGMSRTTFKNASGLHHKYQISSARDMSTLGLALVNDFSHHYHYFANTSFRYKGKTYRGHNKLLTSYRGMDGLKTGYINASGFNLVSSAVRNNKRLIGVVFGGRKSYTRNRHMASLLDKGFRLSTSGTYLARNLKAVPKPSIKPSRALAIAALDTNIDVGADAPRMRAVAVEPVYEETILEQGSALSPLLRSTESREILRVARDVLKAVASSKSEPVIDQKMAHIKTASGTFIRLPQIKPVRSVAVTKPRRVKENGNWSVQVGAFDSRVKSDHAIYSAKTIVPHLLAHAKAVNLQTRNAQGRYLYRARLTGLNKKSAYAACSKINDCLVVAP